MQATITKQQQGDSKFRFSARHGNKTIVYVDDELTRMVDKEFFDKYEIYALPFKCKTWKQICKSVNKLVIDALQSLFGSNYKINYSRKAGCNCGCSPGYIVQRHGTYEQPWLEYQSIWANVSVSQEELQSFRSKWAERFEQLLDQERKTQVLDSIKN